MYISNISYRVFLLAVITLFHFSLISCEGEDSVITSDGDVYETPYGTVAKIDNNPLFTFNYTADYEFDKYIQTGNFPGNSSQSSDSKNFYCTCFAAFGEGSRLVGRNYDWSESSTYFLVFTDPPGGYASVATVDLGFFEYDDNAGPDSPYNLNTLRLLPYYPFDGMNENGVAVGMNALSSARGPYNASKITIGELQLIRLVLDYARTTKEAISLIQQYNIRMEDPPIHYLVADSSGHSAIIEFIDGEMIVMENTTPWQVTTNFIITGLQDHLEAPCWRYRNTYQSLSESHGICSEEQAVNILMNASVPSTRWSNIFNLNTGEMQIAVGRNYENFFQFSIR